ncbi:GapA-binding peptide SR1P [Peribacillus sp. SCS-155]
MGTIICQNCNSIIEHFEDEKVTKLYSKCGCHEETERNNN